MSALESTSSAAGASSASLGIRPAWIPGSSESESATALRQSIRGMETQLVDLVFQNAPLEQVTDWLRVPLECVAVAGNLAAVKRLLAAGLTTKTPRRSAPLLHLAAETGNEGVVEELLKAGADVHETDSSRDDQTALHCAAVSGADAVISVLTSAGADVNELDSRGLTPLQHACISGHRGVVVFLLLKGACAQEEFTEENPPLHLAAMHNHPGVIKDILAFGNVSIERLDVRGRSALHVAARHRRVDACLALLRGGAAVGLARPDGMTCLDVAASRGHAGKLLQVLTMAEPVDVQRRMCSIALYHAVNANKPNTIRDLVALGADVEYRTADETPNLHFAVMKDKYKAAEALLQAGANVEARFAGRTPLHTACSYSQPLAVELLLRWGSHEYAEDSDGSTPSQIVGIHAPNVEAELLPEEFFENQLVEDCIQEMLEMAPADRIWRRRGWLVLFRARWLDRIGGGRTRSSAPLDDTTGTKKRRGKKPGSAGVIKRRGWSLGGGGSRLPEATTAAVLGLEACGVLSHGSAEQAAGVARQEDGRRRFVAVVEKLLVLQEDSIFREIVTFL